jgi:hypothetical protein
MRTPKHIHVEDPPYQLGKGVPPLPFGFFHFFIGNGGFCLCLSPTGKGVIGFGSRSDPISKRGMRRQDPMRAASMANVLDRGRVAFTK